MSTTVCITAQDDGQYKVWVDAPEAAEATGMPAPNAMATEPAEAPTAGEQIVPSLKEALTLAMEALKSGGQMSDANGQQKAFQDGFGAGSV